MDDEEKSTRGSALSGFERRTPRCAGAVESLRMRDELRCSIGTRPPVVKMRLDIKPGRHKDKWGDCEHRKSHEVQPAVPGSTSSPPPRAAGVRGARAQVLVFYFPLGLVRLFTVQLEFWHLRLRGWNVESFPLLTHERTKAAWTPNTERPGLNDFRIQRHESSSSQSDPTAEQLSADWLSQRRVASDITEN
ncbi:hypothetical protein EYF80_005408 [Liparis tanakae]|uniref:Uncharacterized protein n=1 Tax=Liparis tanakae TaxID=230148 RepID=A0A4Z2J235_9TELE|nr:hypothetical protein EYF80_005408 [Liparis tanakae]